MTGIQSCDSSRILLWRDLAQVRVIAPPTTRAEGFLSKVECLVHRRKLSRLADAAAAHLRSTTGNQIEWESGPKINNGIRPSLQRMGGRRH